MDLSDVLRVSFINVGKGDCILICKGSSNVLIDCGYAHTAGTVEAFLKDAGAEALDALIITHYHKDHMGGAAAIAGAFPVSDIFLPDYDVPSKSSAEAYEALQAVIKEKGIRAERVTRDVCLDVSGAELCIFASEISYALNEAGKGNHNDCSLVASLKNGADSYLFAADMQEPGIRAFLKKRSPEHDVLKVPHHANRVPGTADLIAAVRPRLAVITDGPQDPASEEVLSAVKEAGADMYRTSLHGNITVESCGMGSYSVSAFLSE